MKILAIVLIVLGAISLAYGGISYTRREKVIDIGPIQATRTLHETIQLHPVLVGLALVGGIALLFVQKKG